jgi:hypothetical protein
MSQNRALVRYFRDVRADDARTACVSVRNLFLIPTGSRAKEVRGKRIELV